MKILISGGHLTPALSFIDYVQAHSQDQCAFVGRPYSQLETLQKSHEEAEVRARGIEFIPFSAGKISTHSPLQALSQSRFFFTSFFQALRIFRKQKPDLFLSFGGYLAVPLTLVAALSGVPIVTHEQTRTAGLANRFIGYFATAIAVTYEETVRLFPRQKTFVTGNPLRQKIFATSAQQPEWIPTQLNKPILYITGGSQGSQVINMLVSQTIGDLAQDWCVIHQCGYPNSVMNSLKELEQRKKRLSAELKRNYLIREWISEPELNWILTHAKCVVGRSGANTVQEIMSVGKPALFIPLPHARDDEQFKNAQAVVKTGAALLLSQKDATPETFLHAISQLSRHYKELAAQAQINQQRWEKAGDQKLFELVQQILATHART